MRYENILYKSDNVVISRGEWGNFTDEPLF